MHFSYDVSWLILDAVDECVNVVCLNEGTCQSSVNMFQCNCAAGWTGEYCGTSKFFGPVKANISKPVYKVKVPCIGANGT